jgi:hypothetical protein
MWQYFVILAALYMLGIAIYDMILMENNSNGMIVNGINIGIAGGLLVFAGQSLVNQSKNKGHGKGHGDKPAGTSGTPGTPSPPGMGKRNRGNRPMPGGKR